MNLVCITSHELVSTFANMSLDTIEFDNYFQINKSQKVIIIDENGFVEQNLLRHLIELSCAIYYICSDSNDDIINYLVNNNQFNIYTDVDVHSLDAKRIIEITKTSKTKGDVSDSIKYTGKVFSLSSTVDALCSFISAIDSKDVDSISRIFNGHFDDFKNVKSVIETNMLEVDSIRTQIKNLNKELESKVKDYQSLDERYDSLIKYGKECEDDNKRLSQDLVSSKNIVVDLESKLASANERLDELLLDIQNRNKDLKDYKDLIETLNLNIANMQAKNKQLIKDNDVLKTSLNSIKSIPEDADVSITAMGSVSKIIYVKILDPVPYLVQAFKLYQKYNNGTNKNSTGLVMVTSKGSCISQAYIDDNEANLINAKTSYIDCAKSMYVLEGYSADIKKYIESCNCNSVIILDYTFSENIFIKSINQVDLYAVNNKETYLRYSLAPKFCISQTLVENVPCRIPYVEGYDSLGPVEKITALKNNVFTYLDKYWW